MSTHNQELYARGTRAKQWYQRYGYHVLSGHAKTHMVGLLDENEALRVKVAQLEAESQALADSLHGATFEAATDKETIRELEAELAAFRECELCRDCAQSRQAGSKK